MTPKEKAKELYSTFEQCTPVEFEVEYTKKCALIAIDEIIEYKNIILEEFPSDGEYHKYWEEVKQEIEKL